jgi:hypothetical protein
MSVANMPSALFKYLPPARISVLENLMIRFTQASSLNDTLELRPPVAGSPTTRICPGLLERCLATFIPECVRQTKLKHEKNQHAVFGCTRSTFRDSFAQLSAL